MKTSRLAKETAKIVKHVTDADYVPRRQTRSFAASLQAFSANGKTVHETEKTEIKDEQSSSDESTLSSTLSFDIEDASPEGSSSRKRKRGVTTPATTVTSVSQTSSTRISPEEKLANGVDGKVKKAKRQPAKQTVNEVGQVEIHPPPNWEEIYATVQEMRETVLAPVDTMGCETLADEHLTAKVSHMSYIAPS